MRRRDFLRVAGAALACAAVGRKALAGEAEAKRPNILWITNEDISPHLGCYGDPLAYTPNLDKLAAEGRRYTNAFSVAGVCAPSRSCLITGMYPSGLGSNHMRCNNPPPAYVKCYPEYLREAGYFCTNNKKTDYNFDVPPNAWDECSGKAHWRHRRDPDQPFFAIFNFTITHESKIGTPPEKMQKALEKIPAEHRHDPAKAQLPPYYPDTPIIRRQWAHYFDLVSLMDMQAGGILNQLEEDGLAENTIVFYYSDHGVGLPRAKRWLYESGLRVPLIIRWPGHIKPGDVTDRLVSFVDFGPTALSLAGIPLAKHIQGKPFLGGQDTPPREYVYGARDRMDELQDIIRAVRDKRYKYIRNYEPYRPYDQYLTYCEKFPVMKEMRRIQAEGKLNAGQRLFFRQTKPLEELYDLKVDPHEMHNLAEAPEQRAVLNRMRGAMDEWLAETEDLGLVPEAVLDVWRTTDKKKTPLGPVQPYAEMTGSAKNASVFGKSINDWIADLNGTIPLVRLRAIKSIGLIGSQAEPVLLAALTDPEETVAYWAAASLGYQGIGDAKAMAALRKALGGPVVLVRLGAALALCKLGQSKEALPVALEAMKHAHPWMRYLAAQILAEFAPDTEPMRKVFKEACEDSNDYVRRVATRALVVRNAG